MRGIRTGVLLHTFGRHNDIGKLLRTIKAPMARLHSIVFTPNGQRIAAAGEENRVLIRSLEASAAADKRSA